MYRILLTLSLCVFAISNIALQFIAKEICDNGLDDDLNGYVDCFDEACDCEIVCQNNYYYKCDTSCKLDRKNSKFGLELEWETTEHKWHEYGIPIIADVDGDQTPEVIAKSGPFILGDLYSRNFQVYNGVNGKLEAEISSPYFNYTFSAPAIGDVDGNGTAEFFFMTSDYPANISKRKIVCYEYQQGNYVQKWISDVSIPIESNIATATPPNLADFNNDGLPEVYVSTYIFNALNGELLVKPDLGSNTGIAFLSLIDHIACFVAVADVLPNDFCQNCEGLEIIAGNEVFSVNIDPNNPNNNELNLEVRGRFGRDGYTAIADMDKDGDLDAVVSWHDNGRGNISIWDLQTTNSIGATYAFSSPHYQIGLVNLGDFNGDGFPDVGISNRNNFRVITKDKSNWKELWRVSTSDRSGMTGCTIFDFNGDGTVEAIYRDENTLRIFDGSSGHILFSTNCRSNTATEYPVVADVDADGETELICGCGDKLKVWGSANEPWVTTRSIWNQHLYFNVNINDDLTIPIVQQEHHIVGDSIEMNTFLSQYSNPNFLAADANIRIHQTACVDDEINVYFTVCNVGGITLSREVPISLYNDNPTVNKAVLIKTILLKKNIPIDECLEMETTIPRSFKGTLHIIVNDDGSIPPPFNLTKDFPNTSIPECEFVNNRDSIVIDIDKSSIDLGENQGVCDIDSIILDAGKEFTSYLWQDGFSGRYYNVYTSGWYVVEVIDDCDQVLIDSVFIEFSYSSYSYDTLNLCLGDTVLIEGIKVFKSGDYSELNENVLGCDSIHFIHVIVNDVGMLNLGKDQHRCDVDTILLDAGEGFKSYLWQNGSTNRYQTAISTGWYFVKTLDSCNNYQIDSVFIQFSSSTYSYDTLELCRGDTVLVNGNKVFRTGDYSELLKNKNKCDSFILIHIIVEKGYIYQSKETICFGDSLLFNNKVINSSGRYAHIIEAGVCDSIEILDLLVLDTITISTNFLETYVCDQSDHVNIELYIKGGIGSSYEIDWGNGLFEKMTSSDLKIGRYNIIVKDSFGCTNETVVDIKLDPKPIFTINKKDIECYPDTFGTMEILIKGSNDWEYAINDEPFLKKHSYKNLKEGKHIIRIKNQFNCIYDTMVEIIRYPALLMNLPSDTTLVFGQSIYIWPTINKPDDSLKFQWLPEYGLDCYNCKEVKAFPNKTTTYTLIVTDKNGCNTLDEITIYVKVNWNAYVPNVFTPNDDGVNDWITVFASSSISNVKSLYIYDRWGELVFDKEDFIPNIETNGWNGEFKRKKMNPGVFVYVAKVQLINGENHILTGSLTLVR